MKLNEIARHCYNGACNPTGILISLGESIAKNPDETIKPKENLDLKMIIGQISFLIGESLGPSSEALEAWKKANPDA